MLPVVAIVGRPNVGKSTLFNCLTQTRNAVISTYPGTTRDRQYGEVNLYQRHFIIIDTGGITEETDEMGELVTQQAMRAIQDADKIIFLVDVKTGITPKDHLIARLLRRRCANKPILLVVNKTESLDPTIAILEAHDLGFPHPLPISTAHGRGLDDLLDSLFPTPTSSEMQLEQEEVS